MLPSSSNLLVSNGGAGVYGVATTSITCSGDISCTGFDALGANSEITFTGSYENPLTFTYPLTRSTDTISLAFGTTTANTWAELQTFSNGIDVGGTTFTSLIPTTRQLTVAGTANQLTSSAGAQDLSANRTWTLSLPNHVIFPSSFQVGSASTTNATSTNQDITGLLTFNGVTASTWAAFCATITGGAGLCDGSDATGSGIDGFDFDYSQDIGYGLTGSATSTKTQFTLGIHASSTSHFSNATTTLLSGTTAWFTEFIGSLTGNADTATALAADPADCSAGSYALGINTSGAAQGCTDATTEIDSAISTHAGVRWITSPLLVRKSQGTPLSSLLMYQATSRSPTLHKYQRIASSATSRQALRMPLVLLLHHCFHGQEQATWCGRPLRHSSLPRSERPHRLRLRTLRGFLS